MCAKDEVGAIRNISPRILPFPLLLPTVLWLTRPSHPVAEASSSQTSSSNSSFLFLKFQIPNHPCWAGCLGLCLTCTHTHSVALYSKNLLSSLEFEGLLLHENMRKGFSILPEPGTPNSTAVSFLICSTSFLPNNSWGLHQTSPR